MFRGNEFVIGDAKTLSFPSYVIYANDPDAVDQLARALQLSVAQRSMTG
jgi:hypothetical protein